MNPKLRKLKWEARKIFRQAKKGRGEVVFSETRYTSGGYWQDMIVGDFRFREVGNWNDLLGGIVVYYKNISIAAWIFGGSLPEEKYKKYKALREI